jgi:hypothetical protein
LEALPLPAASDMAAIEQLVEVGANCSDAQY